MLPKISFASDDKDLEASSLTPTIITEAAGKFLKSSTKALLAF